MASVVIASFFTRAGAPATDIETVTTGYPKIRIWRITDGTPAGDSFIGEYQMVPMEDGSEDDGFYKFEFEDVLHGYDPAGTYAYRADGGPSLPQGERYQAARQDPSEILDAETVAESVWDVNRADHLQPGSTGEALSQIKADTTAISNQLYLDADSVLEVVQLLLKFETGRTRIDPTANTLTVYDEDCTTPLRVFNLLDSSGSPSVADVCERRPTTKGPGDGTSITDPC